MFAHAQSLSDITGSGADKAEDKAAESHHVAVDHAPIEATYLGWRKQLDDLERQVGELEKADDQANERVNALVDKISALSDEILQQRDAAERALKIPTAKLSTIGAVPAKDKPPEAEIIAQYREQYEREVARLSAQVTFARLANEDANKLIGQLALLGEVKLLNWLLSRADLNALGDTAARPSRAILSSQRADLEWQTGIPRGWIAGLSILIAWTAVAVIIWLRSVAHIPGAEDSFRHLALRRARRALVTGILPAVTLLGLAGVALSIPAGPSFFWWLAVATVLVGIAIYLLTYRICLIALAPDDSEMRVPKLSDDAAARTSRVLRLWCAYAAACTAGTAASAVADLTDEGVLLAAKLVAVTGFAVLGATTLLKPVIRSLEAKTDWEKTVRYVIVYVAAATVALTIAGYVNLAVFIAIHVAGSIVFVAATYFVRPVFHDAISAIAGGDNAAVSRSAGSIVGTILHIGLDIIVLAIFSLVMLAFWGVPFDALRLWLVQWTGNFAVGAVTISLGDIVTAIAVFVLVFVIVRRLVQFAGSKLLNRLAIDAGVRHSIVVALGYIAFVIAGIAAIAILGISLTNLALVFGALSLGVGFGLQNTVDNFVSGLILLIQRPIKVGDWIGVEDYQGFVVRIGVISTEISTVEEASVIIPNSDLISSAVVNRTLGRARGRVDVPIGVAYGSDVNKVFEVLHNCAKEHETVLDDPAPTVVLLGFSDSSLDFELRTFIPDIREIFAVATELRVAIIEKFNEYGVTIPFPQRDLHVKNVPPELRPDGKAGVKDPQEGAASDTHET